MPTAYKGRLIAWLCLVLTAVIGFIILLVQGFPLNTNVLSLLPDKQSSPALMASNQQFSQRMGNEVIFLISAPSASQAQQATQQFSMRLKNSDLFSHISEGVDSAQQQAWALFYFPYRMQLLSVQDRQLFSENKTEQIVQQGLFALYSPMGIANRQLLDNDPFFLYQNFLLNLPKPASDLTLKDGYLMVERDGRWYVMLQTQISGDSFSLTTQQSIVSVIDQATTEISHNGVEVLRTGMLFYAKAGADMAQKEVSTIGLGSIIGIILLMLWVFRSLRPMVFTLLSVASGFIVAFVVTYLVFGSVYLFTLVFGASLIGICVDYAFFYYSERLLGGEQWTPALGLQRIFWGITLGLLNVVIAFAIIAIAPFPGLRQLAVFAVTGLTVAYLTVVCFFPFIMPKSPPRHRHSRILSISNAYLRLWQSLSKRMITLLIGALVIVIAIGLMKIHVNDDIRILESTPQVLKDNEKSVKAITGSDIGMSYIVVTADDPQSLLTTTAQVSADIRQGNPTISSPVITLSDYVPSIAVQEQNFAWVQSLYAQHLTEYLEQIGYSTAQIAEVNSVLTTQSFSPLTLKAWLDSSVADSLKFLWLGKQVDQYAAVIALSQQLEPTQLVSITQRYNGVYYVNKADEISEVFAHYRVMMMDLLVLIFVLLWVFLVWRYQRKCAMVYIIPPLLACTGALATLGWLGVPLTLFSLLALILVLGISMDYVIFLAESVQQYHSTMLALMLSALTTILSFGLLSLSLTPVIHYFGLTVLVGISLAFLLVPIALQVGRYEK